MKKLIMAGSICLLFFLAACSKKASDTTPTANGTTTSSTTGGTTTSGNNPALRAAVLAAYNNTYLPTKVSGFTWNGTTTTCQPGTLSTAQLNNVLQRLNFYRQLDSLPAISFSNLANTTAQSVAALMKANSSLNHTPPSTWNCYTASAASGAAESNLSMNSLGEPYMSIDDWMSDYGNNRVGHRRWILNSQADVYGFGSTGDYSALYWGSASGANGKLPNSIAWPCKGFVPAPLVYDRWSFGIPGADFTNTIVQMSYNGNSLSLSTDPLQLGYADNTIVWLPSGIAKTSTADVTYHVKLTNIVLNGKKFNYEYDVTIFQP